MYTHSGEKNYKCNYCEKTFITTSGRSGHMKHHIQDKKHECTYCDKTFLLKWEKIINCKICKIVNFFTDIIWKSIWESIQVKNHINAVIVIKDSHLTGTWKPIFELTPKKNLTNVHTALRLSVIWVHITSTLMFIQ